MKEHMYIYKLFAVAFVVIAMQLAIAQSVYADEENATIIIPEGSVSASLVSASEDKAGIWDNFGPGIGNANKIKNDWKWEAMLTLPSDKRIISISLSHKLIGASAYGEAWSTSKSDIYGKPPYPLVVVFKDSKLISGYDQSFALTAGRHKLFLYGQVESGKFEGGEITIKFSDGTLITTEVPASSIVPVSENTQGPSISATLVSASEDKAGIWDNFGPGIGNANKIKNDWKWEAMLTLPSDKRIISISLSHKLIGASAYGEAWSTSKSDIYGKPQYPLVVVFKDSKLISGYDQSFALTAGRHKLFLYGQVESGKFEGGEITIKFSDGTLITTEVPASSIVPVSENTQYCKDFDGGMSFYNKSFARWRDNSGRLVETFDICSGSHLLEGYCVDNARAASYEFVCPNGCNNGACILNPDEPPSPSYDLSRYPAYFIEAGKFNVLLVVGDNAPAEDVIAITDIASGLQQDGMKRIGFTKLASDVPNPLQNNIISVGRACNNRVSNQLLGNPGWCTKGLTEGMTKIQLFHYSNKYQIVVQGYSDQDTRIAAIVLANWKNYGLAGDEVCINTSNKRIVSCSGEEEEFDCSTDSDCKQPECSYCIYGEPCTCPTTKCINNQCVETVGTTPAPTCYDGVWNDGETGLDCGGPCKSCTREISCDNGCLKNEKCLPFGTRLVDEGNGLYCDTDSSFRNQKQENEACQNNYECVTNTCSSGVCTDINKQLAEQKSLLKKIVDWLGKFFG